MTPAPAHPHSILWHELQSFLGEEMRLCSFLLPCLWQEEQAIAFWAVSNVILGNLLLPQTGALLTYPEEWH